MDSKERREQEERELKAQARAIRKYAHRNEIREIEEACLMWVSSGMASHYRESLKHQRSTRL